MQLFTMRRGVYCLLTAQGFKGKEKDIIELELDEKNRQAEIEKYGYATVTKIGDTGE